MEILVLMYFKLRQLKAHFIRKARAFFNNGTKFKMCDVWERAAKERLGGFGGFRAGGRGWGLVGV